LQKNLSGAISGPTKRTYEYATRTQLQYIFLYLIKVEPATAAEARQQQYPQKPPTQQASREAGHAQQLRSDQGKTLSE
jgi:hypothetical protein